MIAKCLDDPAMTTKVLFRPVGLKEVELILDANAEAFPPRVPEQPIFYPVLNRAYAEQIARQWNTTEPDFAGFTTSFKVEANYAGKFSEHVVGARHHSELWIPAEELVEFNRHIVGKIVIASAFYGQLYRGPQSLPTILKGHPVRAQLRTLSDTAVYNRMDFACEVLANRKLVLLNFAFWEQLSAEDQNLTGEQKKETLDAIAKIWADNLPDTPLPRGEIV